MKRPLHSLVDTHMQRAIKSLFWNIFVTGGIFLTLVVLFRLSGTIYASYIAIQATEAFQSGIAQEQLYLKTQGDAVADSTLLHQYLTSADYEQLVTLLQQEKDARSIALLSVTNASGAIVSRTKNITKTGDNAFLTTPIGRIVAQGNAAESIELRSVNQELVIATGRPMFEQNTMIGGLFAGALLDDDFAVRFSDQYLPDAVEMVFYTKPSGIYGSSFSDPEIRHLLDAYFSPGSGWISDGTTGKIILFQNGRYFQVENIVFPGLEESPGGALIFIPRQDISLIANIVIGLITVFTFCTIALYFHLRSRGEEKGWRYYLLLGVMSSFVIIAVYLVLRIQDTGFYKLNDAPYVLGSNSMSLSPAFGVFDTDAEQHFAIVLKGAVDQPSQVNAKLQFDPSAVEVLAVDSTQSVCSTVVRSTVDQQAGVIDFACQLPPMPGNSTNIILADVIVKAQHDGNVTLAFDQEATEVTMVDDGLGVNLLRSIQSSSYHFANFNYAIAYQAQADDQAIDPLVVFSPTHPNDSQWYRSTTARFIWKDYPGSAYLYAFDNKPDTQPSLLNIITGSSIELTIPGDGSYYFHLQRIGESTVEHYRIQSDRSPPAILGLAVSDHNVTVGDVVRLSFEAEDAASGIQHNYYVAVDNHLFLPVGTQILIPMSEAGNRDITFRIYDDAGNYSEQSVTVEVAE